MLNANRLTHYRFTSLGTGAVAALLVVTSAFGQALGANALVPARIVTNSSVLLPMGHTPVQMEPDSDSFLARLAQKGIVIQRAVAGKDATEGASFAFVRDFDANSTALTADFAVIHTPPPRGCTSVCISGPQSSIEGRLTSDPTGKGAWAGRVRATIDVLKFPGGLTLFPGLKAEASQKLSDWNLLFENVLTPTNVRAIGIGSPLTLIGTPANPDLVFRWRPFFGTDVGYNVEGDDSQGQTIVRLVPRVRAELFFDFVARALHMSNVRLYGDNTYYILPTEEENSNYFASGLEFKFNPFVGFGLVYKQGEAAPEFQRVHTLTGALTISLHKP